MILISCAQNYAEIYRSHTLEPYRSCNVHMIIFSISSAVVLCRKSIHHSHRWACGRCSSWFNSWELVASRNRSFPRLTVSFRCDKWIYSLLSIFSLSLLELGMTEALELKLKLYNNVNSFTCSYIRFLRMCIVA